MVPIDKEQVRLLEKRLRGVGVTHRAGCVCTSGCIGAWRIRQGRQLNVSRQPGRILNIAGGVIAMKVIALLSYIVMAVLVGWYGRQDNPHLRISNTYKDLMSSDRSKDEVRDYIREKIRSGKFLIKSIHQRQQTISNIAHQFVKRQRDFF